MRETQTELTSTLEGFDDLFCVSGMVVFVRVPAEQTMLVLVMVVISIIVGCDWSIDLFRGKRASLDTRERRL